MFHSIHAKQNFYLLNLFSPWIFCRFLKNVESPFTILWNCLHEICFKLHTSFRLKTGSTTKIFLSFWFVTASRKKSFHISIKSHNIEVKLCSLYQFLKRNGIAIWTIFCPSFIFRHFAMNCTWLARTQTNCGSGKTVYSASSIETFLSSRYYSHSSSFSQ